MAATTWPNDPDGDVLRRMDQRGFDFSKEYTIDFNIDFNDWPPPAEAIKAIERVFPGAHIYEDTESGDRFVLFKLKARLSYDLVVGTQTRATALAQAYGGRCESWGVLHD
jgi:hypothetical protein